MLVSLHRAQAGWVVGWFGGSVVGAAGASSCRQLLSATPAAATFEAPCSWLSWQLRQASCALCPALLRTPFAFRLSPFALAPRAFTAFHGHSAESARMPGHFVLCLSCLFLHVCCCFFRLFSCCVFPFLSLNFCFLFAVFFFLYLSVRATAF